MSSIRLFLYQSKTSILLNKAHFQVLSCKSQENRKVSVKKDKISGLVKVLQMKYFSIFVASKGGLAQLARAFDWQSKGHRFDSDILH